MGIRLDPLPKEDEYRWQFIFRRRLGDYVVTWDWVKYCITRDGQTVKTRWISKEGNFLAETIRTIPPPPPEPIRIAVEHHQRFSSY